MLAWRISRFADLGGEGGMFASGRWNIVGRKVMYASHTSALSLLEIIANTHVEEFPDTLQLVHIDFGNLEIEDVTPPANWKSDKTATQTIGDAWLVSRRTALLRVPSALVPQAWNYLFNPEHPSAAAAKILRTEKFDLDPRLI